MKKLLRDSGFIFASLLLVLCGQLNAQAEARSAAELHSKDAVLYYELFGSEKTEIAWKQTAAYEALKNSGLLEMKADMISYAKARGLGNAEMKKAIVFLGILQKNGVSFSVAIPEKNGAPFPRGTIVLHGAEQSFKELLPLIRQLNNKFRDFEVHQLEREDRQIIRLLFPKAPGLEIGIWKEKSHIVIQFGMNAINFGLDVVTGETANLTENATYQKFKSKESKFTVSQIAWLNVQAVRGIYGKIPIGPRHKQVTVAEFIKLLDLDKVDLVYNFSGYNGRSLWSETSVLCPNGRPFWLYPNSGKLLSLSDLPPLPKNLPFLGVSQFSISDFTDAVLKKVKSAEAIAGEPWLEGWEEFRMQFRKHLGFDIKSGFIETFGETICIYFDKNGGVLPIGIAVKLKDSKTLLQSVKMFSAKTSENQFTPFSIRMNKVNGRDLMVWRFGEGTPWSPRFPGA